MEIFWTMTVPTTTDSKHLTGQTQSWVLAAKSLTPLKRKRGSRETGGDDCRGIFRHLSTVDRSKRHWLSGERLSLGGRSQLGGLFKHGSSQLRSREKFDESVGTVDKCQSSSDRISGKARISANSRTDLAEPGSRCGEPFRVSDRMVGRRPDLGDTRLGQQSRANPRKSRFKEWPSIVLGRGET